MKYVYILESQDFEHFYVGITDDVPARLAKHNAGEVAHTSKYRPWQLKTYLAFSLVTKSRLSHLKNTRSPAPAAHLRKSASDDLNGLTMASSTNFASNAHDD
jgi:hypothetical protein